VVLAIVGGGERFAQREETIVVQRILIAGLAFLVIACQSFQASPTPVPSAPGPTPASLPTLPPTLAPTSQSVVSTSAPSPSPTRPHKLLYAELRSGRGPDHLVEIDASTGETLWSLPRGVTTADFSTMYSAECRNNMTTVSAIALATGKMTGSKIVDGCYSLPSAGSYDVAGLSPNGHWLALGDFSRSARTGTPTSGVGQSRFVVLDTGFVQTPQVVDLKGSYAIDAVDNDGASLYLIEDMPPVAPAPIGTRYQVRRYDLATGSLDAGAIVDKSESETIMDGLRQTSVASADGQWLYSLYLNNVSGPFIHALNLEHQFALCLDLPKASKEDVEKQMLWTLAMAPDGRKLYAANGALGLVAQLDPANAAIERVTDLNLTNVPTPAPHIGIVPSFATTAEAKRLLAGGAAVTADGNTLLVIGEQGFLSVSTGTLQLRGRLLSDLALRSLIASPSGPSIFVVPDEPAGRVLEVGSAAGTILSAKTVANLWGILGIKR
jgi:hypothetical protein